MRRLLFLLFLFSNSIVIYGDDFIYKIINDTICYNVDECGLRGDGITDDLPALNKLMRNVSRSEGMIKIIFSKDKEYRIYGKDRDEYQRIFLDRMNDIVLEGNGCTLSVHPSSRAFAVCRSNNVIIRNFKIDYYPLPYTQGRVTKIDSKHFYLEFVVDEGFPLPIVGDETYYKGGKMVDCTTADGSNNKFYQGHSWVRSVVGLGDRKYGVKYALRDQNQLKINDFFCMKVGYAAPPVLKNKGGDNSEKGEWIFTNGGSIEALNVDGFIVDHIVSHASPVMTFNFRGCSNHIIRNCSIIAKPGRIIAGCSDGIHLKGNEHQPVIENCYFERTMDDAIHIKISGDKIVEVLSPSKFRIIHMDNISDNTNLGVDKEVMLFDMKTSKQLGVCGIIDYQAVNHREGIVTLDRNVPNVSVGTCLYLQASGEALIRYCDFGTQLQRGILTHQPTIVSNCKIVDNGKGFDLALMSNGIEGPPTQFLQVENCLFKNLSYVGLSVKCPSLNYDQKGCPQLVIKNCIFDLPKSVPILQVENSKGVSLVDNKFYVYKDSKRDELFKMKNSSIIENNNNIFIVK